MLGGEQKEANGNPVTQVKTLSEEKTYEVEHREADEVQSWPLPCKVGGLIIRLKRLRMVFWM